MKGFPKCPVMSGRTFFRASYRSAFAIGLGDITREVFITETVPEDHTNYSIGQYVKYWVITDTNKWEKLDRYRLCGIPRLRVIFRPFRYYKDLEIVDKPLTLAQAITFYRFEVYPFQGHQQWRYPK